MRARRVGEPFLTSEYLKRFVSNRSVVDIGGMWGIDGRYSFEAESAGASRVLLVDINETDGFRDRIVRDHSKVQFLKHDATREDLVDVIGKFEVVWCFGLLYHVPDPLGFLENLRRICTERLILESLVIPEVPGFKNMATFFPMQPAGDKNPWNTVTKGAATRQLAISTDYQPEEGFANNFWGLTPSCIEALLTTAGFKVESSRLMSRSLLRHVFVARVA